jgi:hydrogenase maturation protease
VNQSMLSVIGCGNLTRCDDGVGIYVVRRLVERFATRETKNFRIFDAGTGGMDVMFQARGSTSLLLIDATLSGSEPGAIFEAPGDLLAATPPPSFGLHDFRWNHALFAGRKIFKDDFPNDIVVYLIEAQSVDYGCELSEVVKSAAEKVVDKIANRIREVDEISAVTI